MVPSTPETLKRRRIDRYELHELVGEGGMGAVYRAVDSRLGRTVAVKTVVAQRSDEGLANELRQRFMREALAASRVEHRNVVQVIDFGVTEDGTPYLVMEYLRGRDLGVLLRNSKEPLAITYVADVMLCVCAALRACHQQGVVHRDLKPSNIFLADTDTGPEIKVLDFGVSKAPVAGDLTQEGQILGTPQYLSPEQVNGKVGPSSDQYALGVLLYVCLTKKLPFEAHQNLSLLRAIEIGRFPGPRVYRPEIPAELEAIILRAMHADPTRRFDSVHALGQALWKFASQRGQVEWKNYYFQTPPPAEGKTAKGIPFEPVAKSDDGVPVARAVESNSPAARGCPDRGFPARRDNPSAPRFDEARQADAQPPRDASTGGSQQGPALGGGGHRREPSCRRGSPRLPAPDASARAWRVGVGTGPSSCRTNHLEARGSTEASGRGRAERRALETSAADCTRQGRLVGAQPGGARTKEDSSGAKKARTRAGRVDEDDRHRQERHRHPYELTALETSS